MKHSVPGSPKVKLNRLLARVGRYSLANIKGIYNHYFRTDVYIISFPKSGRTWLRSLIGKALCEKYHLPEELLDKTYKLTKAAGVLRTRFTHDDAHIASGDYYRYLLRGKGTYRRKKVILLVRDVKDVQVSWYFQITKREGKFPAGLAEFIRSERYGARRVVRFYEKWYAWREVPRAFLLVRYEEMHADPRKVLAEVLAFLGVEGVGEEVLDAAVQYGSFSNMKKIETERAVKGSTSRPVELKGGLPGGRLTEDDIKYVTGSTGVARRGVVGGYREYLSQEDVRYMDEMIRASGCPLLVGTVSHGGRIAG